MRAAQRQELGERYGAALYEPGVATAILRDLESRARALGLAARPADAVA